MKKNLSYKLYDLFREYVKRKEKESYAPRSGYPYSYCPPAQRHNSWLTEDDKYDGVIYFYELSDLNRAPTMFYNINAFDSFLRRYEIFMPPFQKDIIRQLEKSYVTCKKGTHDLLIRGTRDMLIDAANRANSQGVDYGTASMAVENRPMPVPHLSFVNPNYTPCDRLNIRPERVPPMYQEQSEHWY